MEVGKQEMESESQAVESSSTVPPSATADEHPSWQYVPDFGSLNPNIALIQLAYCSFQVEIRG